VAIYSAVISRIRSGVRARTDAAVRSVLKNTGWTAFGQFVSVAVSLVETIILARSLSITDFGVLVTLTSAAELVYGLLDFRAGEAVIKFIPEISACWGNRGSAVFIKFIVLLDATVSLVGFATLLILGRLVLGWVSLHDVYFRPLVIISLGLAARGLVRSVGSYFRICGRFDRATLLGAISLLGRLVLIVVVTVLVPTVAALSWASFFANLLYMVVMGGFLVFALRRDGQKLRGSSIRMIRDIWRPLTAFLLSRNLEGTVKTLGTKLDTLLIAGLTSPATAAIYKVSGRLASSLLLFSDPLLVAIYPELSHLYAEGRAMELRKLLRNMTFALGAFAVVLIGGFSIAGPWILGGLAGPQYHSAYPVVMIMLCGSVVAMVFFWARPFLLVHGHTHALVLIGLAALIVQLGGLYVLAPSFGALGAGVAFALNYIVNVGLFLYLLARSRPEKRLLESQTGVAKPNEITI